MIRFGFLNRYVSAFSHRLNAFPHYFRITYINSTFQYNWSYSFNGNYGRLHSYFGENPSKDSRNQNRQTAPPMT
ncbi:MAG: hypothetical protein ACO1G9_13030 [Bacteroidota bacterium]